MSELSEALLEAYETHVEEVVVEEKPEPSEEKQVEPVEEQVESAPSESEDTIAQPSDDEEEIRELKNWNKNDKEIYKSLDVKGREFLLRRHREMEKAHTQKLQALAEDQKIAEKYKEIIAPRSEYLKQIGMDPLQTVAYLIDTEKKLRFGTRYEKEQAFQQLSKVYDFPLNPVAANDQPQFDEATQLIINKITAQEQQINRFQQEKESEKINFLKHQIDTFASTANDNGDLKYPHFEAVKKDMGVLLERRMVKSMEEAYEKAIRLNEELYNQHVSMHSQTQKREDDNRQKAAASKKASFNVKSRSSDGISDQKKHLSLYDTVAREVESAFSSQKGRI